MLDKDIKFIAKTSSIFDLIDLSQDYKQTLLYSQQLIIQVHNLKLINNLIFFLTNREA